MDNIFAAVEAGLTELSDEELNGLNESVFSEYKSVKPTSPEEYTTDVVEKVSRLADAKDAIKQELSNRAEAKAALAQQAEAAFARLDEADAEEEAPVAADAEEAPVAEEEAPAEEEPAAKDEEEEEKKAPAEFSNSNEPVTTDPLAEQPRSEFQPDTNDTDGPKGADQGAVEQPEKKEEVEVSTEPTAKLPYGDVDEHAVEDAKASHDVPEETMPNDHPQSKVVEEFATTEVTTESSEDQVSNLNAFSAPEENTPVAPIKAPMTITAGADLGAIAMGTTLTSLKQVAQGLMTRSHSMSRTSGGDGEQHTVATFATQYPSERTLARNDIEGNKAKIDAVASPEAIVAAGGLTAPVETSYDIFTFNESTARPVRDSLPKFGADRGGIRFLTSPTMADLDGAVSVWTLQNDIDAASPEAPNPVKPCLRVQAGEEVEVIVDAIPLCLTFGNLASRAYPELVERQIALGMVWHARFSEIRLLTRIGQLSTNVTAAGELGAARDILNQIEVSAAAYRNRYRIDSNTPLRVMFPEWFRNALRADLIKEIPGNGREGTFNLGEAEINGWFSTRNINVTWFIDGEEGQIFGAQNTGAIIEFPDTLVWYLFSEGTFLFLDAGTLDLGLVRDSTLNGTNDYKIFLETFEGVAKVGIEALRITSELRIVGSTSGTTDLNTAPAATV